VRVCRVAMRVSIRVIAGRRKQFRKRLFTRPDATGSARIPPVRPGWGRCASGAIHAREFAPGRLRATWPMANTLNDGSNNNNNILPEVGTSHRTRQ